MTFPHAGPAQLRAGLHAAASLWPVDARTAVVRSAQPGSQNAIAKANPERVANARRRMPRREGALTTNTHRRDGRCRGRVVRRPLRTRQAKANIEDEVKPRERGTHPQGKPLASVAGPADAEVARVRLPSSSKGAEGHVVAATPADNQRHSRSYGHRCEPRPKRHSGSMNARFLTLVTFPHAGPAERSPTTAPRECFHRHFEV